MLRIDDQALEFVGEQLFVAEGSVEGPSIAPLLARRSWDLVFAFVSRADAEIVWRAGGLSDMHGADCRMFRWLSAWLAVPDPGYRRVLVLEESIWRVGEARAVDATAWAGKTPFHVCWADSSIDDLVNAFGNQSQWPGIGVLARLPAGLSIAGSVEPETLQALVDAAVAVTVGAWDEESTLFATQHGLLELDFA